MPLKLRNTWLTRFLLNPWGKAFLLSATISVTLSVGMFTYFYVKYSRIIEDKLKGGLFTNTSVLYAARRPIHVGDEAQGERIAAELRRAGYTESNTSRMGWYRVRPDAIEINPGADAYDPEGAVVMIGRNRVTDIISLRDHTSRSEYLLEPEPITMLFDRKREKRRLVNFSDIPRVMVDAVTSAEDKRFFQHSGFDPLRILKSAYVDLKERRNAQGASSLTMQLAGMLFLNRGDRLWSRKIPEVLITLHLEQKLTKQQIFQHYANSVYLGNQSSFSINGFGEGSQVYFGKDLKSVTLPEAALLAGLIQSPQTRNPFRYPERAKARRDWVLDRMRDNGKITLKEYEQAVETPVTVSKEGFESSDASYFVDLVNDSLQTRFPKEDFQNNPFRVYTTLDPDLQRDLVDAVRTGIQETDTRWRRRNKKYGTSPEFPLAQVAAVVLDAETGDLKALVGGRAYGVTQYGGSQLNHANSKRQPGSSFKPIVYSAAMMSALQQGSSTVLTPATMVVDEQTTFWFDQKPYDVHNHEDVYKGVIPLRFALAHSLNVPAVKVAEIVGYDQVAATARKFGLTAKPTPAIALGTYEASPLEMATAYTVFPNHGDLVKPSYIKTIRDRDGKSIFQSEPDRKPAIDPRVAYLVEQMMEEVLRSGTGAGVRSRGFRLPAAGKTGTSFDGWFAGFTSKLICVVWVGFDDNRDFKLQGADSALPIWAEFMKKAHQHPAYRNAHEFEAPDGVVTVQIDADTGDLATNRCPNIRNEVFIAGTQPTHICRVHGNGATQQVVGWETQISSAPPAEAPPVMAESKAPQPRRPRSIEITPADSKKQPKEEPRKGFFGRVLDALRSK